MPTSVPRDPRDLRDARDTRDAFVPGGECPEVASLVTPYLRIIRAVLPAVEAERFFIRALAAHEEERRRAGAPQLGFSAYLWDGLGETWGGSLAQTSAWEAMQAIRHVVRKAPRADLAAYLHLGLRMSAETQVPVVA
ncbi:MULTISPECIES: hypothetical protein [unclassified Streptomyces]|uniref:hypothetical protein n=1 Tax=unclassified Streptomyces TaxID=2593676 RepID=UPI0006F8B4F0|nr:MULTISPECIES: hypothetical protein [unclassified Streptomyces]KQX56919.1 hypothetical protein ASD33_28070 [Streptomyces sp. Root1304]KRA98500.1 hypothetical protein ASE09_24880 [Streptomyces sp. Root66D1]